MVDPLPVKGQRALLVAGAVAIHHTVDHVARIELLHELQSARKANRAALRAQLLLIAGGGLCAHAKLFRRAAHAGAVKARRFKDDGSRILHDAAVFAAHHTGHGDGLFRIRNDEHILSERALHAVERGNLLAVFRTADDHAPTLEIAQVKGMHRLAVFQHDIVCDIDNVVNRAHAARAQPLAQPARGRLNAHILNHRAHIAVALLRIQDGDAQVIVHIAAGGLHLRRWHLEGHTEGCRGFARKA